ncbi:conserved membrane protein of unknown function [Rhodovastum atsumiense]|uniref:Uncharacterized protein n=1 Tax=Rhodovastum atsumiense TaxID=504468 RepID=A0A5M6IJM6_9PROT|nr:hypothetical protein [Rhodovastum atsumiense]KAA5608476.1 hypothetical protein F1189_28980 [Rhodovastum atsumiense]CAH2599670.1 conserved membrane protein of unknown function [Rhodovastum atsumiense]
MSGHADIQGRAPGTAIWLGGLACGAVVALATPCAVLVSLLLAPGLVAILLDRDAGRKPARTVLLCGGALVIDPLVTLWQSGQGVGAALGMAADPAILAACWAAQAGAWLFAQILPIVVRLVLDAAVAARAARLRAERGRYETEWGVPAAE